MFFALTAQLSAHRSKKLRLPEQTVVVVKIRVVANAPIYNIKWEKPRCYPTLSTTLTPHIKIYGVIILLVCISLNVVIFIKY